MTPKSQLVLTILLQAAMAASAGAGKTDGGLPFPAGISFGMDRAKVLERILHSLKK